MKNILILLFCSFFFLAANTQCFATTDSIIGIGKDDAINSAVQDAKHQLSQINKDTLARIERSFQSRAKAWAPVLQAHALSLFRWLAITGFAWIGVTGAIKSEEPASLLARLVQYLFITVLMYALLLHYKEWAGHLLKGLGEIATKLGAPPLNASKIFALGANAVSNLFNNLSIANPIDSSVIIITGVIILLCFALISGEVLLLKCQLYVCLNAGIILLGFGGLEQTRSYAVNFIKFTFTIIFKLFVLQLLVQLGTTFFVDITNSTAPIYGNNPSYNDLFYLIGASIVLFALVKSIPDVIGGILNGANVSTGNALSSAVSTVAMGTMAASSVMKAGGFNSFDGVQATRTAAQMATQDGHSGLSKLGHVAKTLGSEALNEAVGGRSNRLRNIHSSIQGQQELRNLMDTANDASTPPPTTDDTGDSATENKGS